MSDQDTMTSEAPEDTGNLPPPSPNHFDRVPRRPSAVEVTRISANSGCDTGLCGDVPHGPLLKQVVQQRWGGGTYQVRGFDSEGKARDDTFTLPGRSKMIVEDDDDDQPVFGPSVYGAPPFGAPPWAQATPWGPWEQPGRPAFAQAYSQQNNRELDRLGRENESLKAELRLAADKHQRDVESLREKLEAAQRELERERQNAMLAKLTADHQKQIADLQLTMRGNSGEPQGDNRVMFEALRSQSEILSSVIAASSKGALSVADIITLMDKKGQGGGLNEALKLHEAIQAYANPSGSDDTWQGVVKDAVRNLAPLASDMVNKNAQQPAQQPAQPAQQIEQKKQEESVNVPWLRIMQEVTLYYRKKNNAKVAASHFRTFYRGLSDWTGEPTKPRLLASLGIASAKLLKPEIDKLVQFYAAQGNSQETEDAKAFQKILGSEEGAAWIDEFLSHLTPASS